MEHNDLVKDIHKNVIDLVKQGAVHNELLREHERRSLALEKRQDVLVEKLDERLKPIENHVNWVNVVLKTLGVVLGGVAIKWLAAILHLV
jgi:hypothetical protein